MVRNGAPTAWGPTGHFREMPGQLPVEGSRRTPHAGCTVYLLICTLLSIPKFTFFLPQFPIPLDHVTIKQGSERVKHDFAFRVLEMQTLSSIKTNAPTTVNNKQIRESSYRVVNWSTRFQRGGSVVAGNTLNFAKKTTRSRI